MRLLSPEVRFPKKLRAIFRYIWLQRDMKGNKQNRFIIKGPRGGGKTFMMGVIGFTRWFLKHKSMVAMGGSLTQAQNVYNYFSGHCYAYDPILQGLPQEPTMHKTESDKGNYFKAVPASPKQVRGPHPDDLIIDEACEAKDEIILAALPMVSSSPDPVVIITSTFHKIFGLFQETWDNAERLGYMRLSWDIFDVMKEFDPKDIWENEKLIAEIPDLTIAQAGEKSLEHRIKNRKGDPEGWVRIENIIQAWREKQTLDWFDVEYMGTRPSASGLVNDPEDVDACVVARMPSDMLFKRGAEVAAGLDWGFSGMTSFVPLMNHINGVKVQLESLNWSQVDLDTIVDAIVEKVVEYEIRFIYADSAGKFENVALQNALNKRLMREKWKCTVIEVVFSKSKFGSPGYDGEMSMLGNYRAYFQRRLLRIPKRFEVAIWQHKRYHYQKGTDKPVKEEDHIPDATMLALKHWPIGRVPQPMTKQVSSKEARKEKDETSATITGGLLDEVF